MAQNPKILAQNPQILIDNHILSTVLEGGTLVRVPAGAPEGTGDAEVARLGFGVPESEDMRENYWLG